LGRDGLVEIKILRLFCHCQCNHTNLLVWWGQSLLWHVVCLHSTFWSQKEWLL